MDEFTRQKCQQGLLQQPQTPSPVLQRLLGQQLCYAEEKAAGKSSCSLLLTCARPPQLSTSSAVFSKLRDFIAQRQSTDRLENEISHCHELHALSSPRNKSFKKRATMRLGHAFLSRAGSCSNTQRVGMRACSSEVCPMYRILLCKDNTGEKT